MAQHELGHVMGLSHSKLGSYIEMVHDKAAPDLFDLLDSGEGPPTISYMVTQRWLTPEAKLNVLEGWEQRQREAPRSGTEGLVGGEGGVDEEMIPWCAQINRLPGVVTLQSCAGHRVPPAEDRPAYWISGQLWLWMDKELALLAYGAMPELAERVDVFELPRMLWQPGGQEVVDIGWKPKVGVDLACRLILDWLEGLRA